MPRPYDDSFAFNSNYFFDETNPFYQAEPLPTIRFKKNPTLCLINIRLYSLASTLNISNV